VPPNHFESEVEELSRRITRWPHPSQATGRPPTVTPLCGTLLTMIYCYYP